MDPFQFIARYFWLIALGVNALNAVQLRRSPSNGVEADPETREQCASVSRGYLLWGSLPWIVMGFGVMFGGVPTVFDFFRLPEGNPYVFAFLGSVLLLWVLCSYWLFLRGGAETLARLRFVQGPGGAITNPNTVKTLWMLCLAGGIAGVVMMWMMDIPELPLR